MNLYSYGFTYKPYWSFSDFLNLIFSDQFEDPTTYKDKVLATGLPASPGAAVGQVVFCADDAETWHAQGKKAILVKKFPFKALFFFF